MNQDRRKYREDDALTIREIEEQLKDPYYPDEHKDYLIKQLFRKFDEIERTYIDDVDHTKLDEYEKEMMKEKLREKQKYLLNRPNKLIRHYLSFVQFHEYAESVFEDETYLTQVSKRGNARYSKNLKRRIEDLENMMPTIRFFKERDRSRTQFSPLLFIGLTYDHKKYSIYDAWQRVGKDFNRYLANLRKHFGKSIKEFRSYEAHEDGYPHIHLILLVNRNLPAVYMKSTIKGKKGAWRYLDYKTPRRLKNGKLGKSMKELWPHGHDDVRVISCVEGVFQFPEAEGSLSLTYNIKYITKDLASNQNNKKALLQNAILWLMKKRAYSFSRSVKGENLFIKELNSIRNDLNIVMSNSNRMMGGLRNERKFFNFVAVRNRYSPIVKLSDIPANRIIQKANPKNMKIIEDYYKRK